MKHHLPYDWVHLGRISIGTGSYTTWRVPGRCILWQVEFELLAGFAGATTAGYQIVNISRTQGYARLDGVAQEVIAELTLRHFSDTDTMLVANKTVSWADGLRITGLENIYLNVYGDQANARPYGQAWLRYSIGQ